MLVLSRKPGEIVQIGSDVQLVVLSVERGRVKLGFQGPRQVPVRRGEISMSAPLSKSLTDQHLQALERTGRTEFAPLHEYRLATG